LRRLVEEREEGEGRGRKGAGLVSSSWLSLGRRRAGEGTREEGGKAKRGRAISGKREK